MLLQNLKAIRKSLGLTQMKLAKEVGVSMLTIQLWENNVTMPREENLLALQKVIKKLTDSAKNSKKDD